MIDWKELDALTDEKSIYKLLKDHEIKGKRHSESYCALAMATGWKVKRLVRFKGEVIEPLTTTETMFTYQYDQGRYPDLEL